MQYEPRPPSNGLDLSDHRVEYQVEGIDVDTMGADPIDQFASWFDDARGFGVEEPHAVVVSTVDADGRPRGRTVLLRSVDQRGFVFYTNYESTKGRALDATGVVALTFHWQPLHRQVHIEGTVERVSVAESDDYFAKRPRESQLGAWASQQSEELANRDVLLGRLNEARDRFDGVEVTRPPFWGGYRVVPEHIEFWQGQPSRLHDRLRYTAGPDGWTVARLSP